MFLELLSVNRLDDLCSFFSVVFDAGAGTGPDQSQDATGDATLRTNFDSRRLVSFLRSAAQVHRKASLAALNSSLQVYFNQSPSSIETLSVAPVCFECRQVVEVFIMQCHLLQS